MSCGVFDPTKTTFSKNCSAKHFDGNQFSPPSFLMWNSKGQIQSSCPVLQSCPHTSEKYVHRIPKGLEFFTHTYDSISLLRVIAVSTGKNPFCDCYISYRVHVYFCPSLPTLKSLFKPALLKFLGKRGHPVESPPSKFKSVYANFQDFYFII